MLIHNSLPEFDTTRVTQLEEPRTCPGVNALYI